MLENFILDAREEGLGEDLIDDDMLPRLRAFVLLGEGLYTALAEETSGKVWSWIGDADFEVCWANFLAFCWSGIVYKRLGAISRHHLPRFSGEHLGSWAAGRLGTGALKVRLGAGLDGKQGSFGFTVKQSTNDATLIGTERLVLKPWSLGAG